MRRLIYPVTELMTPSCENGTSPPVGYILTHYPRLAQTFIADEIKAIEDAGQPVIVFAMNPPTLDEMARSGAAPQVARTTYLKPAMFTGLRALGWHTLRHPIRMSSVWIAAISSSGGSASRLVRRMSHFAQAAVVARSAERQGIRRLHAHFGLAPATIAWLAASILRASGYESSFSFTIHGFHDFVDPSESRLDIKSEGASAVICISNFTLSQLCLVTDASHWSKFEVVRCGIRIESFQYRDPPPIAQTTRLITVGRLSAEKGFSTLLKAVAQLRQEGIVATLRIVGDGPERANLTALVRTLGLQDLVELVGELEPADVRKMLKDADVFVLPSFSEGLPVSIMEAMAMGTSVVATWISGIPELAVNEETALTVPPADRLALASAIGRLSKDDALRRRLARAARERVVAQHDVSRSGEQVLRLLRQSGA